MTGAVLVTGGSGFIGHRFVNALVREGRDVIVVDKVAWSGPGAPGRMVVGDITSRAVWETTLRPAPSLSTVVHLAADVDTAGSWSSPARTSHANVTGTTVMLEALAEFGRVPERFITASSRAVYGEGAWSDGVDVFYPGARRRGDLAAAIWQPRSPAGTPAATPAEPVRSCARSTLTVPCNVYGATKLAQETIVSSWCAGHDVPAVTLRLQNVFGPPEHPDAPHRGVLGAFVEAAAGHRPPSVFEDGMILRDFVHVDEVVMAMRRALDRPDDGPATLDIGAEPAMLLDVATTISELFGAPAPVVTGAYRIGDVRAACCDPAPAREVLGYRPTTALADDLRSLHQWHVDNRATARSAVPPAASR